MPVFPDSKIPSQPPPAYQSNGGFNPQGGYPQNSYPQQAPYPQGAYTQPGYQQPTVIVQPVVYARNTFGRHPQNATW
jgi:hypothetical protein